MQPRNICTTGSPRYDAAARPVAARAKWRWVDRQAPASIATLAPPDAASLRTLRWEAQPSFFALVGPGVSVVPIQSVSEHEPLPSGHGRSQRPAGYDANRTRRHTNAHHLQLSTEARDTGRHFGGNGRDHQDGPVVRRHLETSIRANRQQVRARRSQRLAVQYIGVHSTSGKERRHARTSPVIYAWLHRGVRGAWAPRSMERPVHRQPEISGKRRPSGSTPATGAGCLSTDSRRREGLTQSREAV